jgi:hypothetical protein
MTQYWTQEEIDFANNNHGILTYQKIADKLNKTKIAVSKYFQRKSRNKKLGKEYDKAFKIPEQLSIDDIKFIEDNYLTINTKELSTILKKPKAYIRHYKHQKKLLQVTKIELTRDEKDFIDNNYQTKNIEEMSIILGRSKNSIIKYKKDNKLKRDAGLTIEEKNFIKENYLSMSNAEIAKRLHRTKETIRKFLKNTELIKDTKIAQNIKNILKENYNIKSIDKLVEMTGLRREQVWATAANLKLEKRTNSTNGYDFSIFINKSGIYQIKNTRNNKVYIGYTIDVCRRLKTHIRDLCKNKHYNTQLQQDYNNKDKFIFDILLESNDSQLLAQQEDAIIESIPILQRYNRFIKKQSHNLTAGQKIRFYSNVQKTSGCWLWSGRIHHKDGYGTFRYKDMETQKTHQTSAHRISYSLTNGQIPKGLLLHHTCNNKLCVNPDHLIPCSDADNIQEVSKQDGLRKSNFSNEDLLQIKKMHDTGILYRDLAKTYNCSTSHICYLLNKLKRKCPL